MMMMMMILSDILEFFNMDPSQENFLLSSPSLISLSESPATSSISLLFISLFMLYTSVHIWKGLRLSETFKNVIKIRHSALSLSFTRWLRQFEDARSSASLYLNEKYLRVVKLANRSDDSKSVVDRPTKRPLKEVLEALKCLNEANLDEIKIFVDKYLHEPGYEIENAHFCDWQSRPKFIEYLNEEDLIEFSLALNRIWLDLYKRVNTSKLSDGGVSSHLPMRHPFVVPGGRFREFYYWDTYWTMEGLLVCGMRQTARKMLENLIDLVLTYGFIPNGTRIYYLNRSQPPYFAQMVEKYYESCMHAPDLDSEAKSECERFVLEEALPCLIKEYDFWMSERTAKTNHYEFDFNIFRADTNKPRPESYLEDIETAKMYNNEKDREKLFMDIASAAESGYDFCSRWFGNLMSLSTIETTNIIPVDLNSVMYKNELIIAELCFKKGLYSRGDDFKRAAVRRNRAINRVLWSNEDLCWSDYNMAKRELNRNFYVTNLSPLWMDVLPPDGITVNRIIEKHRQFLHSFDAGVPVSSINNGQQWDFPNVWAPNQYSVVHGLLKHNHDDLALSIARKFFKSVHSGWKRTGCIYEKYSAVYSGERGSGGEYEVQSGFGWTNGVILSFIRTYKDQIIQSNENNNKKS